VRTGGRGKHNIFSLGGAFRKAKYEIRRRRKNRNRKARAGKNFLPAGRQAPPPQLLEPEDFSEPERPSFLFARPSVQFGAKHAISSVQKRFELRSVIATNSDILKIERHLVARSPRLRRGEQANQLPAKFAMFRLVGVLGLEPRLNLLH